MRITRSRSGVLLEGLKFDRRKQNKKRKMSHEENLKSVSRGNHDQSETIEELQDEIGRLRQLTQLQNLQIIQLQKTIANHPGETENQLVRSLVEGLKELSVDTKIQKFCEPSNPNEFIERLEKYFVAKNLQGNRLNSLDSCFDGRARAWFESQRKSLLNYNDFKTKFLSEFFSIPIRVKLKSNWLARRFDINNDNL